MHYSLCLVPAYTKLVVLGGMVGGFHKRVEVINLANPTSSCNNLADYPHRDRGMTVGLIDGKIKSCGNAWGKHC